MLFKDTLRYRQNIINISLHFYIYSILISAAKRLRVDTCVADEFAGYSQSRSCFGTPDSRASDSPHSSASSELSEPSFRTFEGGNEISRSVDTLCKLFPKLKRHVLTLILQSCRGDVLDAIDQIMNSCTAVAPNGQTDVTATPYGQTNVTATPYSRTGTAIARYGQTVQDYFPTFPLRSLHPAMVDLSYKSAFTPRGFIDLIPCAERLDLIKHSMGTGSNTSFMFKNNGPVVPDMTPSYLRPHREQLASMAPTHQLLCSRHVIPSSYFTNRRPEEHHVSG